jgi:hypothetical protein
MESTPKKRKLNQDEIPRITYKWFFSRRDAFKISNMRESFPKKMHMLTMIINEQQTMPYYLSDELASKPYNRNLR